MWRYDQNNLVLHPGNASDPDVIVEVTPENAGWETIHFQSRRLAREKRWSFSSGPNELAIVVLGGRLTIESGRGMWKGVGQRSSVFTGLPHALYLPPGTDFSVTAEVESEFAVTWTPVAAEHSAALAPRLVTPADIEVEIRGGDHATRQINRIMPPGFPCARLVIVEVYTPGGNWSSYPPHKHDVHKTSQSGQVQEADLDEIYYYKIDRPEGYAIQRVYTDPESPLHQAGMGFNAAVMPRSDDVVLIPEGYHPVSSPPGYTTYYLNVLAGSAQSLAATDDPAFCWVKDSYRSRDPRVPFYDVSAAKQ